MGSKNSDMLVFCRYCKHICRQTVQAPFGTFETNYCDKLNRTYTDTYIRNRKKCNCYEDSGRDILKKATPKGEHIQRTYVCEYCGNVTTMKDICSVCRDKLPIAREISLMGKAWLKKYGNKR